MLLAEFHSDHRSKNNVKDYYLFNLEQGGRSRHRVVCVAISELED